MIISANVAKEPAPLNALVWVFGIAGGAALALALTVMVLAVNHKKRRDGDKYHPALSALADHLKGISGKEDWLKESVPQPSKSGEHQVPLVDSTRVLTTGDLVVDSVALRSVAEIATELRRLRKQPASGLSDT